MRFAACHLLLCLLFVVASTTSNAQIIIDTTQTPDQLVQNVLLGNGVSVSNITFNGISNSPVDVMVAGFDATNANLGIDHGLLLCTGDANMVEGPNNEGGATLPIGGLGLGGDADLDQALGGGFTTNDAAVLEFDFIPNGDSLTFRYIFGSEEYLEWVNSSYNDVFGFFISGPGINGPYSGNAMNIALVPGTAQPVSIDNVNDVSNSAYYVDNGDGFTAPQNTDSAYVQFDGITTVLEAYAEVQCGLTYHIKLAVADAGDHVLDSGVFLEAESFSSNANVVASLTTSVGLNDSTLYEGCGVAELVFQRFGDLSLADTVDLVVGGTSTGGVDYNPPLPNGLIFQPGDSVISFSLNAPLDADGIETLDISILNTAACSGSVLQSDFTFYIDQANPMYITVADTAILCGETVEIGPEVFEGFGIYTYDWSTGATTPTITVSPGVTTTYDIIVGDTCGMLDQMGSITVDVPVYPPVDLTVSNDTALACLGSTTLAILSSSGGNGVYTYEWSDGNNVISSSATVSVQAGPTTTYYATVFDGCGSWAVDSVVVSSIPLAPVMVTVSNDTTVLCPGDPVDLEMISTTGGNGVYTWSWIADGTGLGNTTDLSINADSTQAYTLLAEDQCGNIGTATALVIMPQYDPLSVALPPDQLICGGDTVELHAEVQGGAGNYTYLWPLLGSTDSLVVVAPMQDENYQVTVTDQCGYSSSNSTLVEVEVVVPDFVMTYTDEYTITVTNASSSNATSYYWDFGDGGSGEGIYSGHQFLDLQDHEVWLTVYTDLGCYDSIMYLAVPPAHIYVPNSFTPDGDGINDTFGPVGHDIQEFEMRIFDRWGEEIFTTNSIDLPWDGRAKGNQLAMNGVYLYKFTAIGTRMEVREQIGSVTLVR